MAYLMLKRISTSTTFSPTSSSLISPSGFLKLIVHRFLRIAPAYLALILLLEPLAKFLCRYQLLFCYESVQVYLYICTLSIHLYIFTLLYNFKFTTVSFGKKWATVLYLLI